MKNTRPCPAPAVVAGLATLLLSACSTLQPGAAQVEASRDRQVYCARLVPPATGRMSSRTADADVPAAVLSRLPYSPRAMETARIIGVLPALAGLAAPDSRGGTAASDDLASIAARLADLRARQQVLARISLASLEVSSVLAELDCEGERNDQLRDRLQRIEDDRLRRHTLGGIIVGALTAIAGGTLSLASRANAADVAAILGGATETGIGLSALGGAQSARFEHPRNPLGALWSGSTDAAAVFPPSVWQYLNSPSSRAGNLTNRDLLIEQWKMPERLGIPGSQDAERRATLLFGSGGTYTLPDLQVRDAMLDMLEARVALFNQNIADLLREVIFAGSGDD